MIIVLLPSLKIYDSSGRRSSTSTRHKTICTKFHRFVVGGCWYFGSWTDPFVKQIIHLCHLGLISPYNLLSDFSNACLFTFSRGKFQRTFHLFFASCALACYCSWRFLQTVDGGNYTPALWRLLLMSLHVLGPHLRLSHCFYHKPLLFSIVYSFDICYYPTRVFFRIFQMFVKWLWLSFHLPSAYFSHFHQ